jgi:hypothetical protein
MNPVPPLLHGFRRRRKYWRRLISGAAINNSIARIQAIGMLVGLSALGSALEAPTVVAPFPDKSQTIQRIAFGSCAKHWPHNQHKNPQTKCQQKLHFFNRPEGLLPQLSLPSEVVTARKARGG